MKAAVLHEYGKPLVVEEVDLDEPKAGEVTVRMAASGVCHSDYVFVAGKPYIRRELPLVLGHEGAGVVTKVGAGVSLVAPGDHVVLSWVASCGRCRSCTVGRPNICEVGRGPEVMAGNMPDGTRRIRKGSRYYAHMGALSTMAEYAVVPEVSAIKIDGDIPLDKAALVGCAVMTGVGAVINTARVEMGSAVAVFGLGGVGISAIQGAVLASADPIIAVDVLPDKLEAASRMGATHTVDGRADVAREVRRISPEGVDYAFEAIGNVEVMAQAYELVRRGGTLVIIGAAPAEDELKLPAWTFALLEKTVRGSLYGSARPRVDIPGLLALYKAGKLKLDEMVTRTYPLDDVGQAMDDLAAGRNIRGVLTME